MSLAAFVGLGSNLDEPLQQVRAAVAALRALAEGACRVSRLYGSHAVGPGRQPDYVNAALRLPTTLAAESLLDRLQAIEAAQGRVRGARWGARTLDLDLLLYGDQVIDSERLQVPHPRLAERRFVLQPLHDVEPGLRVPGLGALTDLLAATPADSVWPLADA